MSQTSQDEKQGQLAQSRVAERGGDAQGIGDSLQDEEQAEDGAEGGLGRERRMIEITAEGAAESFDTRRLPGGEIGQGAVLDFTVFAEGFAKENGGGGFTIGGWGGVHAY